jgi:uncharacterized protein
MSLEGLVRIIGEKSRGREPVVVALSGGVDSSLVALAAHRATRGEGVAVTVRSELVAGREFTRAVEAAAFIGLEHHPLPLQALNESLVRRNGPDRCYGCKSAIFRMMKVEYGDRCLILDGTTADDDPARPGMRAIREHGVVSPLAECGLDKAQVRRLAREAGLPMWDIPSDSCLATRIPQGIPLNKERLKLVETMENFFHDKGVETIRVYHDNLVATVSYLPQYADIIENNRDKFAALIKGIGLRSCRYKEWRE